MTIKKNYFSFVSHKTTLTLKGHSNTIPDQSKIKKRSEGNIYKFYLKGDDLDFQDFLDFLGFFWIFKNTKAASVPAINPGAEL